MGLSTSDLASSGMLNALQGVRREKARKALDEFLSALFSSDEAEKSGVGNPQHNLEEYARMLHNSGYKELSDLVLAYADAASLDDSVKRQALEDLAQSWAAGNVSVNVKYAVKGVDAEKRITYGVVYSPFEVDLQKEWAQPEVIEKAAHDWLRDYRLSDSQHSWNGGAGVPLESYIAPCDITHYFGKQLDEPIKAGSWIVAMQWSPEHWSHVLKGKITGYSLGGLKRVKAEEPPAK